MYLLIIFKQMNNQKKRDLEKIVEDELHLDELMRVEGGIDTDCDEDGCKAVQCVSKAEVSCYTGVSG